MELCDFVSYRKNLFSELSPCDNRNGHSAIVFSFFLKQKLPEAWKKRGY